MIFIQGRTRQLFPRGRRSSTPHGKDPKRPAGGGDGKSRIVGRGPGEVKLPPRRGEARGGPPGGRLRPRSAPPDKRGKVRPAATEPEKGARRPLAGPRGPLPRAPRPAFPALLAPAGSAEAYYAAVDAGADAVYTGLGT